MHLLYLTAEAYPTHRVDVQLLFGVWMPRLGITSDLVAIRSERGVNTPSWAGGRAILAEPRTGWRRRGAAAWHAVRQLLAADRSGYDAIQVRDMPFIALFGLLAARAKGLRYFYWMSFPIPESHLGMAEDRGVSAGIAKFAYHWLNGKLGQWILYRLVLPRADHVFVQSDQMKIDVARLGIPACRMTPVPMAVDTAALATAGIRPCDDPRLVNHRVLVYLGTQGRPREIERLFDMLALVRREVPEALLVLVGDVEDPAHRAWLRERADAAGVADHVLWTGWLPIEEGWRYVRSAEVGLSPFPRGPLLDSASPTKVPEYLALGVPVVCNDNPDQAAIVAASGAGRCVPYTASSFATAVLDVLECGPDARDAMVRAGKTYVGRHRDYSVVGARLATVYQGILKAPQ